MQDVFNSTYITILAIYAIGAHSGFLRRDAYEQVKVVVFERNSGWIKTPSHAVNTV
jgi:hypothetical protein